MARYYAIELSPKLGSSPWTSLYKGKSDPGALNVELDLLVAMYGSPNSDVGSSTVTIHGVPLSDMQGTQNFYGASITVAGGMQAGLPLANPTQAGLLISGTIFQSFANWNGTEMNISFVVSPTGNSINQPGNFSFKWLPGQSIASAIQTTLQTVYPPPKYAIKLQLGSNYSTPVQVAHVARTLTEFSRFIYSLSKINISTPYGNNILVSDATYKPKAIPLAFTDLIGQPNWVGPNQMQFKTVMRSDIQMGTWVMMPAGLVNAPGLVTTTTAAYSSQLKYKTSFQGTFVVQSARHIGNFRDPDGTAWTSIFEAVPTT